MIKHNFIERSIVSALSFLKDAALCEEHAAGQGFLQSLDPRIKTVTFLMFLLTVIFLRNSVWIGWLYLGCLVLAICSRVPIGFFLIRTWVFIPLFSLFIAIPALFSFVTPGEPVYSFFLFGIKLVITRQGLDGAILFVVRIATSVSFVVLLSVTTRHTELLKVLRLFGVPQIFVMTVSMCYRYLYLFAVTVENIFTAIKSRVGRVVHTRKSQHVVAWNIANTWNRANQMNEAVYHAMLSRGYTGEPRLLKQLNTDVKDWVWLCFSTVFVGLFLIFGLLI
jgi:cobalt/nickel transport system permease protein